MKDQRSREMLDQDIRRWVDKYGRDRSALIAILHNVHREYSQVSAHAMEEIADYLGIHPVEVYGVATFYSFYNAEPKGKKVIRLCRTVSCDMQGKQNLVYALENRFGIRFGETTKDGKWTLEYTSCMGWCDKGPAMFVNSKPYTQVTPEKLDAILAE
jgi:NADH-quinone oxidoreductase E subunit